MGVGLLQFAIGFGTHAAFSVGGAELYDTFGWEMGLGYSGGHGTAALLGNMLQQAGLPYWETAQGVGVTAATFGLVGGILIGICMINWAARTGRTVYLSEPAAIPQALKTGYERDPQRQGSIGKETTYSSSIDTLAGMSQRADVAREAPIPGQDQGHGCGHCQLGTASAAAALMIRDYLRDTGRSGTVIFFGCPAEEGGGGKTFMARSGVFDQLDAALTWHPANAYFVMTGSFQANCQAYFRFQGVTSHAAASPHLGRSALDAVELMNVGANYLREHMDLDDCFHYAMTDNGGSSPNVVPAHAEVIYLMRSRTSEKVARLYERICKIAQGAALMTETELSVTFDKACSNLTSNSVLEELLYQTMQQVGVPAYTQEDWEYAQRFAKTITPADLDSDQVLGLYYGAERAEILQKLKERPIADFICPHHHSDVMMLGSSDVGDVSHVVPTAQFMASCAVSGTPGHSWQRVAQGKSGLDMKGMAFAAQVLAQAAHTLYEQPQWLERAKAEFSAVLPGGYRCPIPPEVRPNQRNRTDKT